MLRVYCPVLRIPRQFPWPRAHVVVLSLRPRLQVAIKILDKEKIQKQNMGSQIKKEISIMKVVKHANVVKLYEVLASRTKARGAQLSVFHAPMLRLVVADARPRGFPRRSLLYSSLSQVVNSLTKL